MEIKALISYEGKDANELVSDFHCAIDDYLEFCNTQGKKPEKAYKGSFNIRVSPELHKEVAVYATSYNTSLNNFVENAIKTCCSCIIISIFKKSHFFQNISKKHSFGNFATKYYFLFPNFL